MDKLYLANHMATNKKTGKAYSFSAIYFGKTENEALAKAFGQVCEKYPEDKFSEHSVWVDEISEEAKRKFFESMKG